MITYLTNITKAPKGPSSVCFDPFERHLRLVPIIPWGGNVISEHSEGDTRTPRKRYWNDRKVTPPIESIFVATQHLADTILKGLALAVLHDALIDDGKTQLVAIGGRTIACETGDARQCAGLGTDIALC